jgi:hypothetical protein
LTISEEFVRVELIEPAKAMLAKVSSNWWVVALMDQTRRQPYNKPAITYEEQVELLQQGLRSQKNSLLEKYQITDLGDYLSQVFSIKGGTKNLTRDLIFC